MKTFLHCCLVAMTVMCAARGQTPDLDVSKLVAMVEGGQADQVRADLPSLLSRYPNNPGLLYVQGLLTDDGAEAVRVYQSVVDNFPRSEWADDALYRVYQFYYSLGLYRTAELKLGQLRRDYPKSKYLLSLTGVQTQNLAEERDTVLRAATTPDHPDTVTLSQPPVKGAASPSQEQYVLQVGAYTGQANAEKQKRYFEDLGYTVQVITKVKDSRSLFTVLVGSFGTYEEAKVKSVELKQKHNVSAFVTTR
jgi:tetratricopeptide (TPR) repeat protein